MTELLYPEIYTFTIPLPDNPLKWLNCYVIRPDEGRCLLIDTGFNREECAQALREGMQELDLRPDNTDIFLTHLHSDHSGNAGWLYDAGYSVMMSRRDHNIFRRADHRRITQNRMLHEGMPAEVAKAVFAGNQGQKFAPGPFDAKDLEDGDCLTYGSYTLRCTVTPGHTPGHMCLVDEEKKLAFLGDHVLFDITPNITAWEREPDSLGDYLDSLCRFRALNIEHGFPAHRKQPVVTVNERIDRLLAHHEARLAECETIALAHPGSTAYEIAGQMTWKIRCNGWDDFPPGQKYFALGETLAHLDYLCVRDRLTRLTDADGNVTYTGSKD